MISPLDSLIVITIQPWYLVVLVFILLIAGTVIGGFLVYRWRSKKIQTLSSQLEYLSTQLVESEERGKGKQQLPAHYAYLQFIYNISHEVANPLQSIQTNLDNMSSCTPNDIGRWQQYHKIITSEINRLSHLTENLRFLSHLETPERDINREPVNLKGVIEDVIMARLETAEAKNVRLVYKGPNRPARVLGDRDHLRQVIMNLVDNGIKYSKDKGGDVIINIQEEGDHLWVRVIDNGIGIPKDDLPFIFDTAYRAPSTQSIRRAGSGLGLAIAKRIVEQHGGKIRVQSSLGVETTISFDLPQYTPKT